MAPRPRDQSKVAAAPSCGCRGRRRGVSPRAVPRSCAFVLRLWQRTPGGRRRFGCRRLSSCRSKGQLRCRRRAREWRAFHDAGASLPRKCPQATRVSPRRGGPDGVLESEIPWRRRDGANATRLAGVAQLVEQLIRNQQVLGSSPSAGSNFPNTFTNQIPAAGGVLELARERWSRTMDSADDFDPGAVSGRFGQRTIARDHRRVDGFGKRHVRGVVSADVVSQLPHSTQQIEMGVTVEIEVRQVSDRFLGTARGDLTGAHQTSQALSDLDVDEVRRM
jgi:hypothetical protein